MDEQFFKIGAKLRYWPDGVGKPYRSVEVIGYTKTGRVRIKSVVTGRVSTVKPASLSVI